MSLMEPIDRYREISRTLAELTNLSAPPAGWRGVLFPAIEYLRASSASDEMSNVAERLSAIFLQLDWAIQRSDVAMQDKARQKMSVLRESWNYVSAPQTLDGVLELDEFSTITEDLERLNGINARNEPR